MTATNVLCLRYIPEDEYHGELHASVQSGGFSGHGSAWFTIETLECFCDQLGAYPLDDNNLPVLEGGYWKDDNTLSETHLSLRVSKRDVRGGLKVDVVLSNRAGSNVHTFLELGYEDLSRFQIALKSMLIGTQAEATLTHSPS